MFDGIYYLVCLNGDVVCVVRLVSRISVEKMKFIYNLVIFQQAAKQIDK